MRLSFWLANHRFVTTLLLLPLFGAFGLSMLVLDNRYLEAFVLTPALLLIGLVWVRFCTEPEERRWALGLFLGALLVRFAASFGLEFIWRGFESSSDGAAYGRHAAALATAWHRRGLVSYAAVVPVPTSAYGYVYLSAGLYWLIGYNTLFIKLVNGLLAALTAVYTYKLGRRLFEERIGRMAALITAFMPSIVLWTSQNLKDSLVLFLSMLALWLAAGDPQSGLRWSLWRLLALGGTIAALVTVRLETAIGLAIVIALTVVLQSRASLAGRLVSTAAAVVVLGLVLSSSGYGFLGRDFLQNNLSVEAIAQRQQATAYGGSAVQAAQPITSLGGLALYLPRAVINFLLRPWPWEAVRSDAQRMTIPESVLIWYPLFALAVLGLLRTLRTAWRPTALIWVYTLAATAAASPQYGNLGTAYRHRVQLWPCFFLLGAVGWYWLRDPRRRPRESPANRQAPAIARKSPGGPASPATSAE